MTHTPDRPAIVSIVLNLLGGLFFASCIVLILILGALFE